MAKGILFPGYGSQFVGMGKDLYDFQRLMQEHFEEAAICLNTNFVKLCFASSDAELSRITNAFPSLFLVGASCADLLKQKGVTFEAVAAVDIVSFYGASFAAGSVNLPDGLYILNKISSLYVELLDQGSITSLLIGKVPQRKLIQWCKDISTEEHQVKLAQIRPEGMVVTGHTLAVRALEKEIRQQEKFSCIDYDSGAGLYVPLFEPQVAIMNSYLEKIDFKDPQVPVLNPLTGKWMTLGKELRALAGKIMSAPLRIDKVLTECAKWENALLSVPAVKLKAYLQEHLPTLSVTTIETTAELDLLAPPVPVAPQVPVVPPVTEVTAEVPVTETTTEVTATETSESKTESQETEPSESSTNSKKTEE